MRPDDPQSGPLPPTSGEPINYRRLDPTPTEWRVVASFTHVGDWHAAKAVLQHNGITSRMGGNSLDETTTLLVSATEVFWAAELLRRAKEPRQDIEQALGFPVVTKSNAKPPPLPQVVKTDHAMSPQLAASPGSLPVVPFDPQARPERDTRFGCLLPILWTALLIVLGLVVLAFFVGNN